MNVYGRYVHIFFGVILLLPLLLLPPSVKMLITGLIVGLILVSAIGGFALIIRAVTAPPLPTEKVKPRQTVESS